MAGYAAMDLAVCGNCSHFRLHFIRRGKQYVPLDYGHCVYPRIKKRTAAAVCPLWKARK